MASPPVMPGERPDQADQDRRRARHGPPGREPVRPPGGERVALVPDIDECGQGPFTEDDLQALAQRLQDPRWTRGTRNIYGLEGLLTPGLAGPARAGLWCVVGPASNWIRSTKGHWGSVGGCSQ